ncbi:MAG: hypothetical protein ABIA63_05045 [bacterium]
MKPEINIRRMIVLICTILGFFIIPLFIIWKQTAVNALIRRAESSKMKIRILRDKNHTMILDMGELTKNSKIEKIARERLDLIYPGYNNIEFIEYEN